MPDLRDTDRWRFDNMVETVRRAVLHGGYSEELVDDILYHVLGRAFRMGREDGAKQTRESVIPITDLTHLPEVWNHVKERWNDGRCH